MVPIALLVRPPHSHIDPDLLPGVEHATRAPACADAFNIGNHPNCQGVDSGTGPDDPTPGLVNNPSNPRILEMVGRSSF
jgi:hypothetical protein